MRCHLSILFYIICEFESASKKMKLSKKSRQVMQTLVFLEHGRGKDMTFLPQHVFFVNYLEWIVVTYGHDFFYQHKEQDQADLPDIF